MVIVIVDWYDSTFDIILYGINPIYNIILYII